MKKTTIVRCAKLLCLLLCVLLLSGIAQDYCRYYDYNVIKLAGFYAEPENTLDVVFLGASDVFTGFSSGYAYGLYGFTSYPYAQDSSPVVLYRSQLREVLKHQDPKLIVIEINGALYDDPSTQTDGGALRRYLNNIPRSANWAGTILELVPREEQYYYFYPLAKSHSNWKSMGENVRWVRDYHRIRREGSLLKGLVTTVAEPCDKEHRWDVSGDLSAAPLEPVSEQNLRDLLDFCRDQGLENVLFVRFPHILNSAESYERYRRGNEAERIIREYGYPFLNLEREGAAVGLDFTRDFYNEDHVNISGQKKLTEYLGRVLTEDYGITRTRLTPEQKQHWDRAAAYTLRFYDHCEEQLEAGQTGPLFETGELLDILSKK